VIVAPLGSNPAHLISLAWALHVHRGLRARSARVVLFASGLRYLERELLAPGTGLDLLHAEVGRRVLPRSALRVRVPKNDDGHELDDDALDADAHTFYDAVLDEARAAVAEAGASPVIFALVGGSRRTLTIAATLVAQYLARPQDCVVDVRYAPKHAADHPGSFYFPTQPDQTPLPLGRGRTVQPKDVTVDLIDVPVPRIGGLVQLPKSITYRGMLEAGQASIDAVSAPELVVDLRRERPLAALVWPDGRRVPLRLGPAKILTLAALAVAQERGEPWLRAARPDDGPDTHPFVELVARCEWAAYLEHEAIQALLSPPVPPSAYAKIDASLNKLRSDTVSAVRAICRHAGIPVAALVPERETRTIDGTRVSVQRLPCRARVLRP
jgi:CRISPR-associated protein (TIGR02584 family)